MDDKTELSILKEKNKRQRQKIKQLNSELGKEKRSGIRLLNVIDDKRIDIQLVEHKLKKSEQKLLDANQYGCELISEISDLKDGIVGLVKTFNK